MDVPIIKRLPPVGTQLELFHYVDMSDWPGRRHPSEEWPVVYIPDAEAERRTALPRCNCHQRYVK